MSLVSAVTLTAGTVRVPAGIDPAPLSDALERYVDPHGLVAYQEWKSNVAEVRKLDDFIAAYALSSGPAATGSEEIAALINAYNAFTIHWILQNYPTESIRELDDSWKKARWNIGGRVVSLDEIEHEHLRPLYGWEVHATIVCAARSCPPLMREAYTAENLQELTDRAWLGWLAREDLNQVDEAAGIVRVSQIFKWFKPDFTGDGAVDAVLEQFAPDRHRAFLAKRSYELHYLDYHWGLNDQSGRGAHYSPSLWRRLF